MSKQTRGGRGAGARGSHAHRNPFFWFYDALYSSAKTKIIEFWRRPGYRSAPQKWGFLPTSKFIYSPQVIQKSTAFTYPGFRGSGWLLRRFGNRSIFVPVRLGLAVRDAMGPVSYYRTTIICFAFLTSVIINDMKNVTFSTSESSQQRTTLPLSKNRNAQLQVTEKTLSICLQLQSTYQEYSARFDRISPW